MKNTPIATPGAPRKIPQWKLDMLKDAEVAAELAVKAEEASKKMSEEAAAKAERDAKTERIREEFAAWKKANPYIRKIVGMTAGQPIPGERGWLVEPKPIWQNVPNNEVCPV